jgi:hypothetical protein
MSRQDRSGSRRGPPPSTTEPMTGQFPALDVGQSAVRDTSAADAGNNPTQGPRDGPATAPIGDALPRLAGTWGQGIYSAVIDLRGCAELVQIEEQTPAEAKTLSEVRDLLDHVEQIATSSPRLWSGKRLVEWWTGSRVETCWSLLHQAELRLVAISNHGRAFAVAMESALAHAKRLEPDDPVRTRLEDLATPVTTASSPVQAHGSAAAGTQAEGGAG